jgi:hypothetical protein
MSSVLYYSNQDEASKRLIQSIVRSGLQAQFHFMCIDNRVAVKNDAHDPSNPNSKPTKTMIVLDNRHQVLMPDAVTHVPALLLLKNNQIVFGDEIAQHLQPQQMMQISHATQRNMEPAAAGGGGGGAGLAGWGHSGWTSGGVVSDTYSFLDQTPQDLNCATGHGGTRQMHHYARLSDQYGLISTGSQSGSQAKLKAGEVSMDELKRKRDAELYGAGGTMR